MVVQPTSGTTGLAEIQRCDASAILFSPCQLCELMPASGRTDISQPCHCSPALVATCACCISFTARRSLCIPVYSLPGVCGSGDKTLRKRGRCRAFGSTAVALAAGTDAPLLPGLELLICAGAPMFADEKREALRKVTPNFHEVYGASAFGPISVCGPRIFRNGRIVRGAHSRWPRLKSSTRMIDHVALGETGRVALPRTGASLADRREKRRRFPSWLALSGRNRLLRRVRLSASPWPHIGSDFSRRGESFSDRSRGGTAGA